LRCMGVGTGPPPPGPSATAAAVSRVERRDEVGPWRVAVVVLDNVDARLEEERVAAGWGGARGGARAGSGRASSGDRACCREVGRATPHLSTMRSQESRA
jgi:hypothetical protein